MKKYIIKFFRLFTIVFAIGLLSVSMLNCNGSSGGGDSKNDANDTPETFMASGTYSYDPDSGVLTANFTSSDFDECGPETGTSSIDVSLVTDTNMVWSEGQEGEITLTRETGTAGDIVGTWDYSDEDGNEYEVNIDEDGTVTIIGDIISCDEDSQDSGSGDGNTGNGENNSQASKIETDLENDGDIDISRMNTFNEDGTIQKLEIDNEDNGSVDQTIMYTYDDRGNRLTSTTEFMGLVTKIDYTQTYNTKNQLIKTEEDTYQQIGGIDIGKGNVDRTVMYTYDESGNKIKEETDSLGGKSIDSVTTFEYDGAGRLTKTNEDSENDGTFELITTYFYNLTTTNYSNDNGRLIKVELDGILEHGDELPDGTPEFVSTYTYDSSGRIETIETDSDNDGDVDMVEYWSYE